MSGARLKPRDGNAAFLVKSYVAALLLPLKSQINGKIYIASSEIQDILPNPDKNELPDVEIRGGWKLQNAHWCLAGDGDAIIQWLGGQESSQPIRELADVAERNSRPTLERKLRIHALRMEYEREKSQLRRFFGKLYWWTSGYGYHPLRPFWWILGVPCFAFALAVLAGADPCNPDTLLYLISTAIPAVTVGIGRLEAPSHITGFWIVGFGVLRVFAWIFTALLLAGMTGMLRRKR